MTRENGRRHDELRTLTEKLCDLGLEIASATLL